MRTLLYVIALIMVIGWIIGFIGYALGGLIHLLLVIAIISILFNLLGTSASGV
ncbi:hypothetical protein BH23BAC3_BH23BAC3_13100 [soil metagenome]